MLYWIYITVTHTVLRQARLFFFLMVLDIRLVLMGPRWNWTVCRIAYFTGDRLSRGKEAEDRGINKSYKSMALVTCQSLNLKSKTGLVYSWSQHIYDPITFPQSSFSEYCLYHRPNLPIDKTFGNIFIIKVVTFAVLNFLLNNVKGLFCVYFLALGKTILGMIKEIIKYRYF